MEIVTEVERRAALLLLAVFLVDLPVANASAQPVDAQAQCFDIISPRYAAQPSGSILLDRCTGQTWLLSKNGKRGSGLGYRWNRLIADSGEISKLLPHPEASTLAPIRPSTGKCFAFQGRQFCD